MVDKEILHSMQEYLNVPNKNAEMQGLYLIGELDALNAWKDYPIGTVKLQELIAT